MTTTTGSVAFQLRRRGGVSLDHVIPALFRHDVQEQIVHEEEERMKALEMQRKKKKAGKSNVHGVDGEGRTLPKLVYTEEEMQKEAINRFKSSWAQESVISISVDGRLLAVGHGGEVLILKLQRSSTHSKEYIQCMSDSAGSVTCIMWLCIQKYTRGCYEFPGLGEPNPSLSAGQSSLHPLGPEGDLSLSLPPQRDVYILLVGYSTGWMRAFDEKGGLLHENRYHEGPLLGIKTRCVVTDCVPRVDLRSQESYLSLLYPSASLFLPMHRYLLPLFLHCLREREREREISLPASFLYRGEIVQMQRSAVAVEWGERERERERGRGRGREGEKVVGVRDCELVALPVTNLLQPSHSYCAFFLLLSAASPSLSASIVPDLIHPITEQNISRPNTTEHPQGSAGNNNRGGEEGGIIARGGDGAGGRSVLGNNYGGRFASALFSTGRRVWTSLLEGGEREREREKEREMEVERGTGGVSSGGDPGHREIQIRSIPLTPQFTFSDSEASITTPVVLDGRHDETSLPTRTTFDTLSKLSLSVSVDPVSGEYTLTVDSRGRVTLWRAKTVDIPGSSPLCYFESVHTWKGYREAQCTFVIDHQRTVTSTAHHTPLYALLYTPKRGLTELWDLQTLRRTGACVLPTEGVLLNTWGSYSHALSWTKIAYYFMDVETGAVQQIVWKMRDQQADQPSEDSSSQQE